MPEIVFIALMAGVLLLGAWNWARQSFADIKVQQAVQQIREIYPGVQLAYSQGKQVGKSDLTDLSLPKSLDMQIIQEQEQRLGHRGYFNTWHGLVWALQGSAAFNGKLGTDREFSLVFEGVPSAACPDFIHNVMESFDFKPLSVFVSPAILLDNKLPVGKQLCLAKTESCPNGAVSVTKSMIKAACSRYSPVVVAMTYPR